jgi:uncharacterized protein YcnI
MSSTHTAIRRGLRRTALVATLAVAGVLTAAGSAFAHVTVHPDSYAKGATDGSLTFRVPNEEDNAGTTQVQVYFPTDHPLLGVLVAPLPGWTATVKTTKLKSPVKTDDGNITEAVSQVTWTKGKIQPGEYQDFTVAFGQLPADTGELTFKTLQTYSDGKVVRWIEQSQPGAAEPASPAPVLQLTTAGASNPTSTASPKASAAAARPATASTSDSTARGLGIGGLVVGVLGLIAAAYALNRGRRQRTDL